MKKRGPKKATVFSTVFLNLFYRPWTPNLYKIGIKTYKNLWKTYDNLWKPMKNLWKTYDGKVLETETALPQPGPPRLPVMARRLKSAAMQNSGRIWTPSCFLRGGKCAYSRILPSLYPLRLHKIIQSHKNVYKTVQNECKRTKTHTHINKLKQETHIRHSNTYECPADMQVHI